MVKKVGHEWSRTEFVSNLILKMSLTEKQAAKLTMPIERSMTEHEIETELSHYHQGSREMSEEELTRIREELERRRIALSARQYRIKMQKFPDFKSNMLINGQPYDGIVYDWKLVEKIKIK
jgi:predicted RNA binding protein with dsRBD fold (UPF0201 family)